MAETQEKANAVLKGSQDSIFVDRIEPLPMNKVILNGIWGFLKGLAFKVADALWTVLKTLYSIVLGFFIFLYKAALGIVKWARELIRKFRFNDGAGRLSFVFFGASSFKNKQWFNGILYLGFEIAYILLFVFYGVPSIAKLSLNADAAYSETCVYDPDLGYETCTKQITNNMIMIMVYGLLWVFSLLIFFFIWKKSIESGYSNYRITHFEAYAKAIDTLHPYSLEIDEDIEENKLDHYSFKELKVRYAAVYEQADAALETPIQKAYGRYVLDDTIRANKEHHGKLAQLEKKLAKAQAKVATLDADEEFKAKAAELQKNLDGEQAKLDALDAPYWAIKDNLRSHPLAKGSKEEADFRTLESERRKQRNLVLSLGDKSVAFTSRHTKKRDAAELKVEKIQEAINDEKKHYLPFVEKESLSNHSSYGRFNVFYRQIGSYQTMKTFFAHYGEILSAYQKGKAGFQEANQANEQEKNRLANEYNQKVASIKANYQEIYAKRAGVEARKDTEKTAYEAAVAQIRSSKEGAEAKAALAEAKATYKDHLKTIGGILDGLPTVKEIKAMEKEELGNATHSYRRDVKSLKTNYSAEEYANYSAVNTMIVDCDFSYEDARKLLKDVRSAYPEADVQRKLEEISAKAERYSKDNPTKFVGKPKTFKEQIASLLDENFHATLLALPITGCVIFVVMPLFFSILIAFTNYSLGHVPPSQTFTWVGLQNFMTLFNPDPNSIYAGLSLGLSKTLLWTLIWAVFATFSNYYLGIIFALMINKDGIKLKKMWRTIFVLSIAVPQFISLIGMSLLLKDNGAFGQWWLHTFGSKLGFGSSKTNDALVTKIIIILVNIWVGVPYTILSTTGILLNIPKDLYESSEIDGAGKQTQFWSITMPYIRFVLGPSLIQTFIGNINNFGVIYFLTGGGPDNITELSLGHTDLLITFLYKMVTSANNPQYGLASTIGIIVFIICAFFSLIMYNKSDAVTKEDQFQ
jgi:ABC-type sugar transport system permease subunit